MTNGNNTVAWLWQNGVMTNLNKLIPPGSPMFLAGAFGINDRGQIAGNGFLPNGDVRGFLLTPAARWRESALRLWPDGGDYPSDRKPAHP